MNTVYVHIYRNIILIFLLLLSNPLNLKHSLYLHTYIKVVTYKLFLIQNSSRYISSNSYTFIYIYMHMRYLRNVDWFFIIK